MTRPDPRKKARPEVDFQTLGYRRADNGVVFLAIDVPDRPLNVLTPELHAELGRAARAVADDADARGMVIHSAKSSFMAGGDLKRIVRYYDQNRTAEEAYLQSRTYTESLRALETCGKPVAVAVNGTALGGGLELALAGHYRVVADDPDIRLGLPEVSLGLIPGGGGTQRLPRLIGLEAAARLILEGKRLRPAEALDAGLVDRVVPADELLDAAEAWILEGPDPHQPWDVRGFRIPGGSGLNDMKIGGLFQRLTASVSAKYRHNYPAPVAALNCLFNGTTVRSMEQALAIETREFSALTRDPVARNMIRLLFLNRAGVNLNQLLADPATERLKNACLEACAREGEAMASAGMPPTVIENVAFAAGLSEGPFESANRLPDPVPESRQSADPEVIRNRLLCAQALAACECWEEGITEPKKADLASHFGWGFPSYTGGVLSFVDTLGLGRFISLCRELTTQHGANLVPSQWLCEKADLGDRIYPSLS